MQARVPLSMLRLSTAEETEATLAMAGHEQLIHWLKRLMELRGIRDQRCMLLFGATGSRKAVRFATGESLAIVRKHGGVRIGRTFGNEWRKTRFLTPYLRNTLWEAGYAIDTLETATQWSNIQRIIAGVDGTLRHGLEEVGERVLAFSHLSHMYPWGSSIYTTYMYRIPADGDPDETLRRWQVLKAGATQAIVKAGATITHQHGVGTDHLPYMPAEKGRLGMMALRDLCRRFDPSSMMNPGKLCDQTTDPHDGV